MRAWRPSYWLGSRRTPVVPRRSASPSRRPCRPEFETLEDRVVPAIVGTPNQNFVAHLYSDLTNQSITEAQLAADIKVLSNGSQASRLALIQQIESGTAHRQLEINGAVRRLLHHSTTPTWTAIGMSVLGSGGTLARFEATILDSPEFFRQHGATNDGWLTGVYARLFGTAVPTDARTGWDQVFAAGYTRFQIAPLIANGIENLGGTEGESGFGAEVDKQFDALLGRHAKGDINSGELAAWTNFGRAAGIDAVIIHLALTPEYYAHVQTLKQIQLVPVPGQEATTLGLTSSLPTSNLGQNVTFTATVSPAKNRLYVAGGQVTFFADGTQLGNPVLVGSGGKALLTTNGLSGTPPGSPPHTITASYSGDADFTSSASNLVTQTVTQGASSIALIPLSPRVKEGTPVMLEATLNGGVAGPIAPGGTVTFFKVVGTTEVALGPAVNVTSLTVQGSFNLTAGDYQLTAAYSGDASYKPSHTPAPPLAQHVNPPGTPSPSVNVTTSATGNQAPLGTAVTFTATVSAPAGDTFVPTGTVTFLDQNGNQLGGKITLNATGVAVSDPVNSLAGGAYTITAVYDPGTDPNFSGTNGSVGYTAQKVDVASVTVPSSSSNPSDLGAPVTFTATVTAPTFSGVSFTPSGTVDFYDGTTKIGSDTLAGAGGTATATFMTLLGQLKVKVGGHSITAVYNGDGNFNGKTSGALTQTVNPAGITITIDPTFISNTTLPNPTKVSLRAMLTPTSHNGVAPNGTVSFHFNDGNGSVGDVSATSSDGITWNVDLPLSSLTTTYTITASFGNDTNFTPSTSIPVLVKFIDNGPPGDDTASSDDPEFSDEFHFA